MNQRLITAAPEMRLALMWAVETLKATEIFMKAQGLDVSELNQIIDTIDEILNRIDGTEA